MTVSEVACLRQQRASEYQAAQSALSDLALGMARHQFITTRMENMQHCQEQLVIVVGNKQEAARLVAETLNSIAENDDKLEKDTYYE